MRFEVLGDVRASHDGRDIALGGTKTRLLLATLLAHPNRALGVGALVDALWEDGAPASAPGTLRWHVHQLRSRLDSPERIEAAESGYVIRVEPAELDSLEFEALLAGPDSGPAASKNLDAARDLWRGNAFGTLADHRGIRAEALRLEQLRLEARERRISMGLAQGRHTELLAELAGLVRQHPERERVRAQLMLALYRSGRRADALREYLDVTEHLLTELGLEPGAELRELERAIRADDPALGLAAPANPAPGTPAEPAPWDAVALPAGPTEFVGRDALLSRVARVLGGPGPSVVAIDGVGGIGKSAAAIRVAHALEERFPDGRLFLDLGGAAPDDAPVGPAESLAILLRSLGHEELAKLSNVEELSSRFRSITADRRVLIVLDDAHNAAQLRPLLPSGEGCAVLVTSRRRLVTLPGVRLVSMERLSPKESHDLLVRLTRHRVGPIPPDLDRLAERCDGLPLALNVCAALLDAKPRSSVADLVERLREAAKDTRETGDGDPALGACLRVSYERLDPAPARLFRLLGLHAGPDLAPAAAAALAGAPAADTDAPTAAPAVNPMATPASTRSSTTDVGASSEVSPVGTTRSGNPMDAPRSATPTATNAGASAGASHLGSARGNPIANPTPTTTDSDTSTGAPPTGDVQKETGSKSAAPLQGTARAGNPIADPRSTTPTTTDSDTSAGTSAAGAGGSVGSVEALEELVRARLLERHRGGRYRLPGPIHRYAAELAKTDDAAWAARRRVYAHYCGAARACMRVLFPETTEALRHGPALAELEPPTMSDERALAWVDAELANVRALARRCPDNGDLPAMTVSMGGAVAAILHGRRRVGEALALCELIASVADRADQPLLRGAAYANLGRELKGAHRLAEATECLLNAREHYARADAPDRLAEAVLGLAAVYREGGELSTAEAHADEALEINRRSRDPAISAAALIQKGLIQEAGGAIAEALETTRRAAETARTHGLHCDAAAAVANLAWIHKRAGEPRRALDEFHRALDIDAEHGLEGTTANAARLWGLAQTHYALGERDRARQLWTRAAEILRARRAVTAAEHAEILDVTPPPEPSVIG